MRQYSLMGLQRSEPNLEMCSATASMPSNIHTLASAPPLKIGKVSLPHDTAPWQACNTLAGLLRCCAASVQPRVTL